MVSDAFAESRKVSSPEMTFPSAFPVHVNVRETGVTVVDAEKYRVAPLAKASRARAV